jgi:hypothetical protein
VQASHGDLGPAADNFVLVIAHVRGHPPLAAVNVHQYAIPLHQAAGYVCTAQQYIRQQFILAMAARHPALEYDSG